MPKVGYIQNGVTKTKNGRRRKATHKRRRRNGAVSTIKVKRRNGTTKAGAMSFAKKNGLMLVSKNGRKRKTTRRRRRNGTVLTRVARTRNGLLGNSKRDAHQVIGVLGGMAATKIVGRIVSNFAAPYVAQLGLGQYTELLVDAGVALFLIPPIARKIAPKSVDNARLGGLAVVGLEAIDKIGGSSLSFLNPFNSTPIVMANGQAAVPAGAVAQIVANTSATPAEKSAVLGAMRAIQSGVPVMQSNMRQRSISPLYD